MNGLGDLKTYLPFAKNSFQQLISYKANVIMFMFGDGLMLAVTYYLWKAIYSSTSDKLLNGFKLNEMIRLIINTINSSTIKLLHSLVFLCLIIVKTIINKATT